MFELVIRQFEVSKIQDWCAEKCYFLGFWLSWKKKKTKHIISHVIDIWVVLKELIQIAFCSRGKTVLAVL